MIFGVNRISAMCLACVALLWAQTLQAAADSPFLVDKKTFKKSISSVALSPLSVPALVKISDEMRLHIEAEATKALKKTKLQALDVAATQEIQTRFTEHVGGLMNASGEIDSQRLAVVRDHTRREMRLKHPVDGFADLSLRVVRAPFANDRAEWDGVKRKIKVIDKSLFGGKDYQGSIAAVSLQLAIYDRSENLLYLARGGVDVLQDRQGDQLILRTDDFLNDPKRLKKAVQAVFKPL